MKFRSNALLALAWLVTAPISAQAGSMDMEKLASFTSFISTLVAADETLVQAAATQSAAIYLESQVATSTFQAIASQISERLVEQHGPLYFDGLTEEERNSLIAHAILKSESKGK